MTDDLRPYIDQLDTAPDPPQAVIRIEGKLGPRDIDRIRALWSESNADTLAVVDRQAAEIASLNAEIRRLNAECDEIMEEALALRRIEEAARGVYDCCYWTETCREHDALRAALEDR